VTELGDYNKQGQTAKLQLGQRHAQVVHLTHCLSDSHIPSGNDSTPTFSAVGDNN
jgi:hypothetical protein